jgi:hypothetical protein
MISDIEKAFHQVAVNPSDRDALRILWVKDINYVDEPDIVVYRYTRVVFGFKSSPYLLNHTLQHHIDTYGSDPDYGEVANRISRDIYVDNVALGVDTVDEALEYFEKSVKIMKDGNFNLRQWISNSAFLNQHFVCAGKGYSENPIEGIKVLGVYWNINEDSIIMNISDIIEDVQHLQHTKRNVLRILAKIHDPLGLVTPITTTIKYFLQQLWKSKLLWDDILDDNLSNI